MTITPEAINEMDRRAREATPGPWTPCYHLKSLEYDLSCPCGYRGGIWGGDDDCVICEMGSTESLLQKDLSLPRYDRPQEIRNAAHIYTANPTNVIALIAAYREQSETIARQAARIEALEAGLQPFVVSTPPRWAPDDWPLYAKRRSEGWPTCGDIRRAVKLLTNSEGGRSDG